MSDTWKACQSQARHCLEAFRQQRLAEADLAQLTTLLDAAQPRQGLLYLQLRNTNPGSQVLGMSLFVDGKMVEPPADPAQWPYQSVLAAIAEGWRVISFPELALLMDEAVPQTLGCEFILEKWT
ncbi:MAG: hypothetical protein FJY95_00715 [Candidatus Handelsmanbacteria bacterium]|nr:hypothetical protein [Candidatus Handelsmanbacteria bacterium]